MTEVQVAVGRRAWADVERLVAELVSGEQNAERLSRMVLTVVGQTAAVADALDYLRWALARGPRHWRWLHTRRLAVLAANGSAAERSAALAEFVAQADAHLAQQPDDVAVRLSKVENVCRFGAAASQAALAADLDRLEAALADDRLSATQRERIGATLDRCRRGKSAAAQPSGLARAKRVGATDQAL